MKEPDFEIINAALDMIDEQLLLWQYKLDTHPAINGEMEQRERFKKSIEASSQLRVNAQEDKDG